MAGKALYTFLLIDDKKDRMEPFITAAKQRSIRIVATDNVEDGLAKLKADEELINAVILDALCKMKRSDTEEHLSEMPLRLALGEIKNLEQRLDRFFPKCVYTADDRAAQNSAADARVFRKGPPGTERALFDYLIGEVKSNPVYIVEQRYHDVLSMFVSGHLPENGKEDLLRLLLELDEINPSKVKSNLTRVRTALEMMLTSLGKLAPSELPEDVLRGHSWVSNAIHYLAGKDGQGHTRSALIPDHLFSLLYTIQKASSSAGAHYHNDFVSHYAMRSLAYGLLEAMLWFKTFVDENYPDQLNK